MRRYWLSYFLGITYLLFINEGLNAQRKYENFTLREIPITIEIYSNMNIIDVSGLDESKVSLIQPFH